MRALSGWQGTVRLLPMVAVATLLLLGDGGSLRLAAPTGPVHSRPPLSVQDVRRALEGDRLMRTDRRSLEGLARAYIAEPADARLAVLLLESARVTGRTDWLRQLATALSRRLPTGSTLLLRAELEYAEHGYARGIGLARAAHAASPEQPEIGISYAAALAGTGEPLQALDIVSRWAADPDAWAALEEPTLQRLAVILAAVAPETLGELASSRWLQRSWRSQEPAARLRALAFSSALAERLGRAAVAAESAEAGLEYASRAAGSSTPIALMGAVDVSGTDTPLVGRIDNVCALLPAPSAARRDCLASALRGAVVAGDFTPALRLYELARRPRDQPPVLTMRLAIAALPLLELVGAYREASALAERAAVAAGQFGDAELEGSFRVRLARARRLLGDYPGAQDAALRATEVTAEGSALHGRAEDERSAATRALLGERERSAGLAAVARRHEKTGTSALPPGTRMGAVIDTLGTAERLDVGGNRDAALRTYLHAIGGVDAVRGAATVDLLESIQLGDVWIDVNRRALGLALQHGDAKLALDLLERRRAVAPAAVASSASASGWLPRGSVMIAYAIGPDRPAAIVLRDGIATLVALPTTTPLLRDRVTVWRELAKGGAVTPRWTAIGRSLAATLIEPVTAAGLLEGAEHLYVVPDDVLHLVSFATLATLATPAAGSRHVVTQAPSLAILRRALAVPPAAGPLVAFGVRGGSGMLEEMAVIRRAGGQVLMGPRATEAEWRRRSAGAAALHFGGHAAPSGRFDASAALQLRGDRSFDGLLTIADILSVPLAGSTVVLLGCDTATRSEQPGPASHYGSTPSLGEAFLHAGARAVVGNLWPITEQDAALLAQAFYGAGGPRRGAAALEEARASLRSRFPDLPRRWAGAVWLGAAGAERPDAADPRNGHSPGRE